MSDLEILQLHRKEPYPPSSGVDTRVWETAERLNRLGDVSIAAPWSDSCEVPTIDRIDISTPWLNWKGSRIYAWNGLFVLGSDSRFNIIDRLITDAVLSAVAESSIEPDLVVCECLQLGTASYRLANQYGVPLLVNHHNSEFTILDQFLADRGVPQGIRSRLVSNLHKYEQQMIDRADAVVFQSSEDIKDFDTSGGGDYRIVPNGTDIEQIRTSVKGDVRFKEHGLDTSKPTAIYVGAYDYEPNKKAADAIAERIAPACPNVQFLVVGRDPPSYDQVNVYTPGFVEDLGAYLQFADIALCPLTMGSGTKLKMLDYLAAGLPVVTTPVGTQGLELEHGEHVFEVDRIEEFPDAIQAILESPDQRTTLEENSYKVAEQYSWETLLREYDDIVQTLINSNSNRYEDDKTKSSPQ